jgi:hypothetical protein
VTFYREVNGGAQYKMRVRNVGWSKKEMWRKSVFHTWNSECASFCFFFVMSPAIFVSSFCTV